MRRLRALIEQLLPWYDPERDAAKDQHVAATVKRANQVSDRIRAEFRPADTRLSGRGR